MTIMVRPGTDADANAAIDTICRSISVLCVSDHQNDPVAVSDWLGNKTPANWAAWVARADAVVLVAEVGAKIVGVGMIDHAGTILLNYVHPDARFMGVSAAILAALEEVARKRGLAACVLESTITARRFYQRRGYVSAGSGGVMSRFLQATGS